MAVLFILLLLAAVLGLRAADGDGRDYMSVKMTNSIKGFFLGMVFLAVTAQGLSGLLQRKRHEKIMDQVDK